MKLEKLGPREKSLAFGIHTLSNEEVLAIILGTGTQSKSVLELAKDILADLGGSLMALQSKDVHELTQINGVGLAKAMTLKAAFELAKRQRSEQQNTHTISSSRQAYEWAISLQTQNITEEFWALYLNRANKIVGHQFVSKGGMNATVVDIRLIAKRALELKASNIIVFHNHPSGSTKPSNADRQLTHKLRVGLSTLELTLLDHLIIAQDHFFSFADEGLL